MPVLAAFQARIMATNLAEPSLDIPLNTFDKEVLEFWKLKNRYDHVHYFLDSIRSLCAEINPCLDSEPPLLVEPEIYANTLADPSLNLDLSVSDVDATVLSPLATSPILDLLEYIPEQEAIQSPDLSTSSKSTETLPSTNGRPISPPASPAVPVVEQPEAECDSWQIVHKTTGFHCRRVTPSGFVASTLGPFATLNEARAAIGLED